MTSALLAAFPDGKNPPFSFVVHLSSLSRNCPEKSESSDCDKKPAQVLALQRVAVGNRTSTGMGCCARYFPVYRVLSCFRMTHWSADAGFVQAGWAVGLTGCHCGRRAARGAPRRNPSGLEAARAVSHLLLMRSYMAGGVQVNLRETEKLYHSVVSRVVFYILLLMLVLVTMWNNSGPTQACIAI